MFFVFNFLVFAFLARSEINCFTQGTIRAKNYVKEREQITNLRGAPQFQIHITSKRNTDLKSNVFDKILTDEMLSVNHSHTANGNAATTLCLSTKRNPITPTLELKQKWPIFKYINNVNEVARTEQNKYAKKDKIEINKAIKNVNDNLDLPSKFGMESRMKLDTKGRVLPENNNKLELISDTHKFSKNEQVKNKVVRMTDTGVKEKCMCKQTGQLCSCNSFTDSSHNKKRCTHATANARTHECTRYGVTNHSCNGGPLYQSQPAFVSPMPYSFYPVYLPYSYFASEPPDIPYRVSYPQPNLISDLKIPRKHRHKHHKYTTRIEDDLYYEDNDSRERRPRPYDDNDYYSETKKATNKGGFLYDVDQDTLIKEIVKDLKIQNDDDFSNKCYCNSSLTMYMVNTYVLVIALLCFTINAS